MNDDFCDDEPEKHSQHIKEEFGEQDEILFFEVELDVRRDLRLQLFILAMWRCGCHIVLEFVVGHQRPGDEKG